jgi:hypothetical protein
MDYITIYIPKHLSAFYLGWYLYTTDRVDIVLGYSTVVRIGAPTPSPAGECAPPPPFGSEGGTQSLAGERVGGPNSDEGTDTVVL